MFRWSNILILTGTLVLCGCKTESPRARSNFSRFVGMDNFSHFIRSPGADGTTVLLSPEIKTHIVWNQLIVSWNATAPAGTFLKIEAAAISAGRQTRFYTLGDWSPDNATFPRTSVPDQNDAEGSVDTDTLILKQTGDAAQLRITLGGTNGRSPTLKFLGLSFANTKIPVVVRPPNRAAWGKIISTPEFSQHGYPDEKGWCSPTSLDMVLARWASLLNRPEMILTVPEVAAAVYDDAYGGTGNWPFNTAFAGSFPGLRAYVTRLDDLSEVEDWIVAGVPVILSARWDWLQPGRPMDDAGHLIVCIGFTKNGDVVVNDPATRLGRGESVQHIYKRQDVIHSWSKSHNAVYLVYPVNFPVPHNDFGHW